MFCSQCGKQIPTDANFCQYCGTRLRLGAQTPETTRETVPVLELKPHYVPATIFWPTLVFWGFFTVWCCLFCGGFPMFGVQALGAMLGFQLPPGVTFIFWGAAAFFGVPVIAMARYRRICANTTYRIFSDRIESVYERGAKRKVTATPFSQVTGLEFKRVRQFPELKLGTITVHTPFTVRVNNRLKNMIQLDNIENGNDVYERLRAVTTSAPPPTPPSIITGD